MEKDGLVLGLEEFEGAFEQGGIVAVDRSVITEAEIFKDDAGEEHVLHPGLDLVGEVEGDLAADGFDELGGLLVEVGVGGLGRDLAQIAGDRADVFRDGPFVVVEHDDEAFGRFGHVVHRLEADPAGESGVAGHHDDVFAGPAEIAGRGHAEAGGEGGAGVAGTVAIVLAFGAEEEAVQSAGLTDGVEALAPPGEHFVHIALVADVEEELVLGRIKGTVQGDGQFDHAEVGPEVAAGLGNRADELLADFLGEEGEILLGDGADIGRAVNPGEEGCFKFLRGHRILRGSRCHPLSGQ